MGDQRGMICNLAAGSERASGLADAEILKLADQYIVGEQEYCDLNKLVDKMEGEGKPRGYRDGCRRL